MKVVFTRKQIEAVIACGLHLPTVVMCADYLIEVKLRSGRGEASGNFFIRIAIYRHYIRYMHSNGMEPISQECLNKKLYNLKSSMQQIGK